MAKKAKKAKKAKRTRNRTSSHQARWQGPAIPLALSNLRQPSDVCGPACTKVGSSLFSPLATAPKLHGHSKSVRRKDAGN